MAEDSKHSISFPLDGLIERLELAGFQIGLRQRLQLWRVLQRFGVAALSQPERLKYRLAPLVAGSPSEQERFYQIFDKYLEDLREYQPPETEGPLRWWERLPRGAWAAILLLGLVLGGGGLWWWLQHREAGRPRLLRAEHPPRARVGDTITLYNRSLGYDSAATRFRWELRDARSDSLEQINATSRHWRLPIGPPPGSPDKTIRLLALTEAGVDTFQSTLRLRCANPPEPGAIVAPADTAVGAAIRFRPAAPEEAGLRYEWDFGDGTRRQGYAPVHAYEQAGGYRVRLRVRRPAAAARCERVIEHRISLGRRQAFLPLRSLQRDRMPAVLYFGAGPWLLLGLFALLALYFWYRWLRRPLPTPDPQRRERALAARFARADRAPYRIPFRPQEARLRPGAGLYRLARVLRLRQEGAREELDLPATIRETIERGGFPALQRRRTTVPPNYLFLIDEQAPHSHQARLYRYLLDFLREQDVEIEAFWYKKDPYHFWNARHPGGLSLELLQQRYPDHRLLVMGDAHHLLDPLARETPQLRPGYAPLYRRWNSRLLLTPRPARDWTFREATLYDLFALFPGDAEGLQSALAFLETEWAEEDERAMPPFTDWRAAQEPGDPPPSTNYRQWNRLEAYDAYFRDRPALYRWFCALMVYPAPSWPLTLAIGHAIGAPVNFDNLLMLSRIPFLQGRPLPPRLRLQLLGQLQAETERAARAAVARELEAAAPAALHSHANGELQTQLALQQFLLEPESEERREALRHLLAAGQINQRERAGLEAALQRQTGAAQSLETYLQAPGAHPPGPTRRPFDADFYRGLSCAILALLLAITFGSLDGTRHLHRLLPEEQITRSDFLLRERQRADSAVQYNNRAAAAWDSLRRNSDLRPETTMPAIAADLERALALRNGAYPLAALNRARHDYHAGVLQYRDYLQTPERTALLAAAERRFRRAAQNDSLWADATHGLGLAALYRQERPLALNYHDRLQAAGYFDSLRLAPNLRTLLFPTEGGAVLSDCVSRPQVELPGGDTLCPGDSLRLRNLQPDQAVDSFLIRWGDGRSLTRQSWEELSHAYGALQAAGTLEVEVLAFAECAERGAAYNLSRLPVTLLRPPRAAIGASITSGCAPLEVRLENAAATPGTGARYEWNLGNGATATGAAAGITYRAPGNYSLRLRAANGCGQAEDQITIEVLPAADCEDRPLWRGQVQETTTGDPIAEATLRLSAPDRTEPIRLETDSAGRFKSQTFPAGAEVTIKLEKEGYADTTFRRRVTDTPLALRLRPEALPDPTVPKPSTEDVPLPQMRPVPGGTFTMGCKSEERDGDCYSDERPAHEVTVDDFYMSVYEVTVGQFAAFIKDSGYKTDADKEGRSYIWTGSDYEQKEGVNWKCDVSGDIRPQEEYRHPVIHVSWNDAVAYAEWLSEKTGQNYRLPTEAEWEYAARGGEVGAKDEFLYSGSDDIDAVAWYDDNSGSRTHEVGQKQPNQLGLYDMSGNVWEWCEDDWHDGYNGAPADGRAWIDSPRASIRVGRGGSWGGNPRYCRAAYRDNRGPPVRDVNVGFRLAL